MDIHELSEPKIRELSMVLHTYKGQNWRGRNPNAVNFAMKGAAEDAARTVEIGGKPVKVEKAAPAFIEELAPSADEATIAEFCAKGWLLPEDTPDNIDGDGDGAEDYEKLVSLLMGTYYDLSSAMNISGESARAAAITTTIDTFRKNFEDVCGGGDGDVAKAGARHSKVDQKHIDAISDHAGKMKKALGTFGKHADAIASHTAALQPTAPDGNDGDPDADGDAGDSNKGGTVNDSIAPEVLTKTASDAEVAALKAELQAYKGGLDAYRVEMDAKLATATQIASEATASAAAAVETAKGHEVAAGSKLEASKAAVVAASRAPRASGAGPVVGDDMTSKGAPSVYADPEAGITKIDRATSTPGDVIKAARERANAGLSGVT